MMRNPEGSWELFVLSNMSPTIGPYFLRSRQSTPCSALSSDSRQRACATTSWRPGERGEDRMHAEIIDWRECEVQANRTSAWQLQCECPIVNVFQADASLAQQQCPSFMVAHRNRQKRRALSLTRQEAVAQLMKDSPLQARSIASLAQLVRAVGFAFHWPPHDGVLP